MNISYDEARPFETRTKEAPLGGEEQTRVQFVPAPVVWQTQAAASGSFSSSSGLCFVPIPTFLGYMMSSLCARKDRYLPWKTDRFSRKWVFGVGVVVCQMFEGIP